MSKIWALVILDNVWCLSMPFAVPYNPHRPTLSSSSYGATPILVPHGGCNGQQALGSCLTHLSSCFLGFDCPSYQARFKTTQFCSNRWRIMHEGEVFTGATEMMWDLLVGSLERLWFCQFLPIYMYVLYFTMQSAMEWDLYILGSMRYAFSLLPCLKSHGLVSSIE